MNHPQQGIEQHTHSTYQQVVSNAGQPAFDLNSFWQEEMTHVANADADFKNHALPLARIKKVMKTDQDVKMISAEAPILFAKGSEIFIAELTKRAWVHAEENKRRTLQRSDIAHAISKSDMYDFLIDIVPREEITAATGGAKSAVYESQNTYPGNPTYYPPSYPVDTSAYYPPLPQFTNDQVQQYQMQMQQFAQQNPLPHPQDPSHPTYQAEPSQPTYQDEPSRSSYPDPKHSPSYQSRPQEPPSAYDSNTGDELEHENK